MPSEAQRSPVGLESCFGPVRNPINEAYIPGGSSSGSAAVVAAHLCYATLDTDAIGSCRLPAACCGVVGLKPTFGVISTRGILEGMFANYVGLPAISVPCGYDSRGLPIGLQIVGKPGGDATVLSVACEFERGHQDSHLDLQ